MLEIIIDGKECTTKKDLFQTFAKALDFPEYFGNNWDSFDELMGDLSWIKEGVIVLHITNFNDILSDAEEEDKDTFFDIISNVEEYSGKKLYLELANED